MREGGGDIANMLMLQVLEGVQLAPHLYEPDINKFIAMDKGQWVTVENR